jgi:hypothetical protein
MSNEIIDMHKYFADWMRPVCTGTDRETLVLRWKTVSRIVENEINLDFCDALIRYSFGEFTSPEVLEWFQNEFKVEDISFSMIEENNRLELQCLATVVLCVLLENKDELSSNIGTRLLSVQFFKLREVIGCTPIIQLSIEAIKSFSIEARKRPKINNINLIPQKKVADDFFDKIIPGEWETYTNAIKGVYDLAFKQFSNIARNTNYSTNQLKSFVDIQDEEIEMLWWLVNAYSKRLSCQLSSLNNNVLSTVVGIEIADITFLNIEIPSLEAILSRTIPNNDKVSIRTLVETSFDYLDKLTSNDDYCCKYITPCHYAFSSLRKFGKTAWVDNITLDLGVSIDVEISLFAWAIQICRERLIIKMN